MSFDEFIVEEAALTWVRERGYSIAHGRQPAPGEPTAEGNSFSKVVLVGRSREAIWRLNPATAAVP